MGCDQGTQHDEPPAGAGSFVHIVAQNVSVGMPLPADGRIELAFDRYLHPASVTRQTFALHDLRNNPLTPTVAYDPVSRIVTITPNAPLAVDQAYEINIFSPSNAADSNGLRAIDGATLDPKFAKIGFAVRAGDAGPAQPAPPTIDFCKDILPIFTSKCAGSSCHGASPPGPAAGLRFDSPEAIAATAIGRVAEGANTGPRASTQPTDRVFGIDMPIIDPGSGGGAAGNPSNSWLLYKLLLAAPPPRSSTPAAMTCNGGNAPPTDVGAMHLIAQPAFSNPANDPARASLVDYVLGREMPYPDDPGAQLGRSGAPLTIDELERVSRWIAQPQSAGGRLVPSKCGCIQ